MRVSARARRLILRVAFDSGEVIVTVPRGTLLEHGFVMARSRADWIVERLDRLPPRVPFEAGATIPVRGKPRRIVAQNGGRCGVRADGDHLMVAAPPERLAAVVATWLRGEARHEATERSTCKAGALGLRPGRIAVRDTRTRWGSCSAGGNLSFSWRLILAPEPVLDYVVAHECAHLRVRGHGPEFWRTVASLADGVEASRAWLRQHGHTLHRYG